MLTMRMAGVSLIMGGLLVAQPVNPRDQLSWIEKQFAVR
jgi:hypothetical protein